MVILLRVATSGPDSASEIKGYLRGTSQMAATSRAIPRIERQSLRFGVTATSMI
jgi:hypothetical protein